MNMIRPTISFLFALLMLLAGTGNIAALPLKFGSSEIYIGNSYRLLSQQMGNGNAVNYLYDYGRRLKNGNTTQKGTQHFSYNYRNQLLSLRDGLTQIDYTYDALGRRTKAVKNNGNTSRTTHFYYSGNQVIEERDGSNNVQRQFIYGTGIDEIIRMDKYAGSLFSSYYFHADALGSITAITDEEGKILERYAYDIYGMPTFTDCRTDPLNPTVVPRSIIGNHILFQGREYDPDTNLYYYRARTYDPIMGRFLQTDPMGYMDSMNLYQAFNMNGLNFVDPLGLNLKLTSSEMSWFKFNLSQILTDIYWEKYGDGEEFKRHNELKSKFGLEHMVAAFTRETGIPLDMPEEMTVLDKIVGSSKAFANFPKSVGDKVKKALGSDKAQEKIENAKDHWLVKEADAVLPGHLSIDAQINLEIANDAGIISEFTTEELQWAIVAGAIKGGIKFVKTTSNIKKSRKLWEISRYDKVKKWGNQKIYRDPVTEKWWSKDFSGHGGSAWKVFDETDKGLQWFKDADEYGDYLGGKHKGPIGMFIPWKELH